MKALVTGANGLLGRAVVAEFLRRGHAVRVLVRPAACLQELGWDRQGVEVFRGDLRVARDLEQAFEGIDTLVHLAAAVTGNEDLQFASTVVGTERLLEAMAKTKTKHLVLASSLSVYDWSRISGTLTEESPLEADVYARDGYAIAKLWQERVARRHSRDHGWRLTVVRPGFIWGARNEFVAGIGQWAGRFLVVIGPLARPPLTHVVNCADAFVTVAERGDQAGGQTFNVADGHDINSWRFAGYCVREFGSGGFRLPVPYWLGLVLVRAIGLASRIVFRGNGKLPSLFVPSRFEARFKPVRCDCAKLRGRLRWVPPLSLDECLRRTFRSEHQAVARAGAASKGSPVEPKDA